MAEPKERDSRSLSHDYDDSDKETDLGKDGPAKPGRKKNPNSQAARRDQNRIAQREFRLRKQQRIRDLEARVEMLSGTKDETFNELRNVVKDLMQENTNLRNLIRSLGGYIGDGMGGILPTMGFDRPQDFVDFINRAETDTAFEGFQRRKKAAQAAVAAGNATGSSNININITKKRSFAEDDSVRKRVKGLDDRDHLGLNGTGSSGKDNDASRYPVMPVPISPAAAGNSFYSPVGRSTQEVGLFSELLQGQGTGAASSMYMTGPAAEPSAYAPTPPGMTSSTQYPSSFHPPIGVASTLNSQPFLPNITSNAPAQTPSSTSDIADNDDSIDDPKLQEATKLIHYHLENYKRNNAYCLPQSLRPTLVQRTVPHESVIDGIPHPELRDRLILLRGRFDLVDAMHEYAKSLILHGDDVLAHNNWEIGESWLRRYGFLVDQPVLNICNRWRRERGEPELLLADIQHSSQELPTTT